mgnify:FL=1|tara:strand:- start:55103 stop:56203 length:1101 start_codon:yes stop_codon:yes gene_type:complete
MLSRQQKGLVRAIIKTHKTRVEQILNTVSIDERDEVADRLLVHWGAGLYFNAGELIRSGDRMTAVGMFRFVPDDYLDVYENMDILELLRVIEVVVRIRSGNEGFHTRNKCGTCLTGDWMHGECMQCTTQSYPGIMNERLKIDVPTNKDVYLTEINYFFKDADLSEIYYDRVVSIWGDVALQKNIISFIADNWDNTMLQVVKHRKVKSQLAIRTRLSNRGIDHGYLNDHQLLKAVWFFRAFDAQAMKNKRNEIMKFNKTMKRISKRLADDKYLQMAIVDGESNPDEGHYVLDIEKKNRNAFRFFRDQFCGQLEKNIDRVRGQGGSMRVCIELTGEDSTVGIELFNPDGSEAGEFIVTQEGTKQPESA